MDNTCYKNPFSMRKDHLNCPLPLTLESYWNCEANCLHCVGRRLNKIWGQGQKISDPRQVRKKLTNALKNKPKSPLATALHMKKPIWLGRKTDSYQPIELEKRVTRHILRTLIKLRWPVVIRTKYTANLIRDVDLFLKGKNFITILIEITCGQEKDWELFEHKRPTPPAERLKTAQELVKKGLNVGIRGEPYIPGYHTFHDFRDMIRNIKKHSLNSYNTYNLHMNEMVLENFYDIGLDIEKIWEYNQDKTWKGIQRKLCEIAEEEEIRLGCPDFVNTPKGWVSCTNTCCGVDVPNVFTFNTHHWKKELQTTNELRSDILSESFEGIGTVDDKKKAWTILFNRDKDFYTMKDAGL